MSYFVHKYPGPIRTIYKMIPGDAPDGPLLITGMQDQQALLLSVNRQGDIQWARKYTLGQEDILFYHCLPVENGERLVLGRVNLPAARRVDHLLVRVDQQGIVLWAKRLTTPYTRSNTGIEPLGNNEYVIVGWHNHSGSNDKIEMVRIDGNGNLLTHTVSMELGYDTQVLTTAATPDALWLAGGGLVQPSWRGFVTQFNLALKLHVTWLIKHPQSQSSEDVQALYHLPGDATGRPATLFAGVSRVGSYYRSFVGILYTDNEAGEVQTIACDVTGGNDHCRKLLFINDHIYILGQQRQGHFGYVLCLDLNLQLQWARRLELEEDYNFSDALYLEDNELWITGFTDMISRQFQPLIIKTDLDFTTCSTMDIPNLEVVEFPVEVELLPGRSEVLHDVTAEEVELGTIDITLEQNSLCPERVFQPDDNALVQSPHLYLQTTGSMGMRASEGNFLRWFLLGKLGELHLPKGNHSQNTNGFNKPDDFVYIYRAPYGLPDYQELDFMNMAPIYIDGTLRRWVYQLESGLYYLHFADETRYQDAVAAHAPATAPWQCLEAYGDGLLELELHDQLAFSVSPLVNSTTPNHRLQMEVFSTQGDLPVAEAAISARKTFSSLGIIGDWRIVGENIRSVQFRALGCHVRMLRFECYADLLTNNLQNQAWESLGAFALTTDTPTALQRLEDSSRFQVHGHWQKYSSDAPVNIQNYIDRWSLPNEGLQAGVAKYLQLSETDPKALEQVPEQIDGEAVMDISYLDMLQVAGLDYHHARMLGLGHIDTPPGSDTKRYVYLAEYVSWGQLDDQSPAQSRQHLYLSLPTAKADERLPEPLETLPLRYGLELYTGTDEPLAITDAQGYAPFDPVRYVNIHARPLIDYTERRAFYQPSREFARSGFTAAAFAGLVARIQSAADWEKPSPANDPNYLDAGSTPAFEAIPVPIPQDTEQALYVYEEEQEGIRAFSALGVNIFSVVGTPHNTVFSDYTKFVKPNTLLPPHQVHVQLIQKENPLLLTSANEQAMLSALDTAPDKTLVRLTFQYHHQHDGNYDFGDQIEVFFRPSPPGNIQGRVLSVTDDADTRFAIVTTAAYTFNSTGQTVTPQLATAIKDNYLGGALTIGEARYIIEDILQTTPTGDFPTFKIRKLEDQQSVDLGGGRIVTTRTYSGPSAAAGELFMAVENMARAESWGNTNPLPFHIAIDDSSWSRRTETVADPEAGTISKTLRGVWDTATITPMTVNASNDPLPPGFYEVLFDNYRLPHHAQWLDQTNPANVGQDWVDWHGGVLRVAIQDTDPPLPKEKKVLDVVRIEHIGDGRLLRLVVHDEQYDADPKFNILSGSAVEVNFYPGYRAYLHQASAGLFDEGHILPAAGEGSRNTLLALRAADTLTLDALSQPYHSRIGTPQLLHALEIIAPQQPLLPTGSAYATPPDLLDDRSTYSILSSFQASPYGIIYYRAELNSVLRALYKKETYEEIKSTLLPPDQDDYYSLRIQTLVNDGYDESSGQFPAFPLEGDPYAFPKPDNDAHGFLVNANDPVSPPVDPPDMKPLIKAAVLSAFVPLTEQPLIFDLIKGGDYIPKPVPQRIRDKKGRPLAPTDPDYDLAPMAKRVNATSVRFTDFTLSGAMSPDTAYLYCVRELGNRLDLSEASPILGPVLLVNTSPPEAPVVRKLTTQLASEATGRETAINFELNAYPRSRNIKKIRIYRAVRAVDALSPRTMTLAREITLTEEDTVDGIISLQDDFSDVAVIPYGEPLFYRIVALRALIYEDIDGNPVTDYVPSEPSKRLLTNVVDVVNPSPPKLVQAAGNLQNDEIRGLVLEWTKTTHNGTYHLFQLNPLGNWSKLTEIRSNDEADLSYAFSDPLPKTNEDDEPVYHRFKVTVENSSGLMNVAEEILTV